MSKKEKTKKPANEQSQAGQDVENKRKGIIPIATIRCLKDKNGKIFRNRDGAITYMSIDLKYIGNSSSLCIYPIRKKNTDSKYRVKELEPDYMLCLEPDTPMETVVDMIFKQYEIVGFGEGEVNSDEYVIGRNKK